jgi:hypothetical protein
MKTINKHIAKILAFIVLAFFFAITLSVYVVAFPFTLIVFVSALILQLLKHLRNFLINQCIPLLISMLCGTNTNEHFEQFVGGIIAALVMFGLPIAVYIYKTGGL